jgi:pseudaminic acid synthase
MIISTGMATLDNIKEAVEACKRKNNSQIILLKCTSSYPAPVEEANLRTMQDIQERFQVIPGLSDHTLGITVPIVAAALGAKVIEKHFILDRNMGGPDSSFSLNPSEFKQMVESVREAEKAKGTITYELSEKVEKNRQFARSLFVVEDVEAGERFTSKNIRSIRPGHGLHPRYYPEIIGKTAKTKIERGTPLNWDFIS